MKYKTFLETRKEIIIVTQEIEMTWNSTNKTYYTGIGYEFTGMGEKFVCKVSDLSHGCDRYITTKCPVCGKERDEAHNKVILKGHTLCMGCRQADDITGEKFRRLTVLEVKRTKKGLRWRCVCECGKEKLIQAGHLKSGATTSCGCYNREVTMALSGENSPYWNHDLSEQEREARRAYQSYARWRTAVFERDGYACCVCGHNKGGDLRAHHLFSYKKHKKKQLDIDNGITLCVTCHDEFHRIYMGDTRIPCTLIDFIKWLLTKQKKPTDVVSFLKDLPDIT